MDVVRLSAVGAVAACAVLALVSTARQGRAEPPSVPQSFDARSPGAEGRGRTLKMPSASALDNSVSQPPAPPLATIYGASLYPLPRFSTEPPASLDRLIDEAARRFAVPPSWIRGVMRIESGGRTMLGGRPTTSPAGAMGLMQVMPRTFAELTQRYGLGRDPYDPRANILAGAAFLREMYDRYGPEHFLEAYNAGPGRVDDHLRSGRPLPFETQRYTLMLAPRLLDGQDVSASGTSPSVQDLTTVDAIRRAALPLSRSRSTTPPSPAAAAIFVTANGETSTAPRQVDRPPRDALFIQLTPREQRASEPRDDGAEN